MDNAAAREDPRREARHVRWGEAWLRDAHGPSPRGVALLAHGLNLRPDRMVDVERLLAATGFQSLVLSLRGHGENFPGAADAPGDDERRLAAFRAVTHPLWRGEAEHAYDLARERARSLEVPLVFVGYSLGGLIGVELACDPSREVAYDGMILFAPALATRALTRALRALSAFPRLVLPSFSPAGFSANRGTPMAAYNALFDAIASLRRADMSRVNVPTVLFADPRDELVSFAGLRRLCQRKDLNRWALHPLERRLRRGERDYHHLIVAKERLGPEAWQALGATIAGFLDDLVSLGSPS